MHFSISESWVWNNEGDSNSDNHEYRQNVSDNSVDQAIWWSVGVFVCLLFTCACIGVCTKKKPSSAGHLPANGK